MTADAARIDAEMTPLFARWAESLSELYGTYTDSQLETICDFMSRAGRRQRKAPRQLSQPDQPGTGI